MLFGRFGVPSWTGWGLSGYRALSSTEHRPSVDLEHVSLGGEDGRSIVLVERVVLVEDEEEVLERLRRSEGRLLVFEDARAEIENGGETTLDARAVVDVVQHLLGELEVEVVLGRLVKVQRRLDELGA